MENAMTRNNQIPMEQFVEKFCEMVSNFMKSGKAAEYEKKTATTKFVEHMEEVEEILGL